MENEKRNISADKTKIEELAGKYLTFMLGNEEYGLQILKVQEIIRLQEITAIPKTPDFVRGVINLRDRVIPVIELRTKFGMKSIDDTDKTCIVVVQVSSANRVTTMGVIIDEVREVRDVLPEEIEETPSFGTTIDIEFIMGIAKVGGSVKMLLNINKVLSADEISSVAAVGK